MSNLVPMLRALAAFQHGDVSFAEEAADEIEELRAELDEYVQEVMRQHKVIAGMQDHAYDLTRQIKEMRAEIVRLRVEAGYD